MITCHLDTNVISLQCCIVFYNTAKALVTICGNVSNGKHYIICISLPADRTSASIYSTSDRQAHTALACKVNQLRRRCGLDALVRSSASSHSLWAPKSTSESKIYSTSNSTFNRNHTMQQQPTPINNANFVADHLPVRTLASLTNAILDSTPS